MSYVNVQVCNNTKRLADFYGKMQARVQLMSTELASSTLTDRAFLFSVQID